MPSDNNKRDEMNNYKRIICASLCGWLLLFGTAVQAQSALTGTAVNPPPPAKVQDYRLGPGDLLRIVVFDHAEMSLETRVSQSGSISFPPIGSVSVGGLPTHDVELLLARRLAEGGFVRNAQVSAVIIEYQSRKVSVIGQVNKPGQYALTEDQRLMDVLSMAGGVVADMASDEAMIMRKDGRIETVNVRRLLQGDLTHNLPVDGGDTISVPRAAQFYIYGEVQKPGVYRLGPNMTVSQAISMGGGLTRHGTERRAVVKRRSPDGVETEYRIRSNEQLQPDDVVFIKESLF